MPNNTQTVEQIRAFNSFIGKIIKLTDLPKTEVPRVEKYIAKKVERLLNRERIRTLEWVMSEAKNLRKVFKDSHACGGEYEVDDYIKLLQAEIERCKS